MSALGQKTLISLLTDKDAVDLLAREGLDERCVPDEQLRKVMLFALRYFHQSGQSKAPTIEVLVQEFGDLFADNEIVLGEADETIEWALDDLKGTYAHKQAMTFNKTFAQSMSEADTAGRIEVVAEAASELVGLSLALESREYNIDAREGLVDRLEAYHRRAENVGVVSGMTFGIPMVDEYTCGIQDGEVAILAAPAKTGKSYFLDMCALHEWRMHNPTALYTLENSVEMTLDRIACLATGVDSRKWLTAQCDEHEVERVTKWIADMANHPVPLWVLQPDEGKRTAAMIVQDAQLRGVRRLFIDQLSHMEHEDDRAPLRIQIGDTLRTLRLGISTGRHRMPCLMAHQINRDGTQMADKLGHLEMWHMAESADVERGVDWVFGLYQSRDQKEALTATFQTLAARRAAYKHFLLTWNINVGVVTGRGEIDPYET